MSIKIEGDNNVAVSGDGNQVSGGSKKSSLKVSIILSISIAVPVSIYFIYHYVS